jgi:uncharacterized protein (DUF433 family)
MEAITRTPGVQGGEPCVAGTRTPVRSIAILYYEIYQDRFEVQRALPHLTLEQIDTALTYYLDHKAEIDALIEGHERALRELEARS